MTEPIALTCPGLLTPGGNSLDELIAAMDNRQSPIKPEQFTLNDHTLEVPTARVDLIPEDHFERARLRRLDRLHQLGLVAARDTAAAFGAGLAGDRTGIIVGSVNRSAAYLEDQYRVALTNPARVNPLTIAIIMGSSLTGHVAQELAITGPSMTATAECATGLAVLATACDWIRLGHADQVLIGGADATITFGAVAMFRRMNALTPIPTDGGAASRPFDRDRAGFVMGEGACFAIIERLSQAERAGREVTGIVEGCALRTDTSHLIAPDATGAAQRAVIAAALEAAGLEASDVVSVNAHATSTPANDVVEANAIANTIGPSVPVTAVKGVTGHMFAASGLTEALLAGRSATTGHVPHVVGLENVASDITATICTRPIETASGPVLTTSFGFGGHDACAVLCPAP